MRGSYIRQSYTCVKLPSSWLKGLQLLNLVDQDLARIDALQKEKSGFADNLMYVRIRINGKDINAILALGATHMFIVDRLVKELGLQLSSSHTSMKAVNLKA